MESHNRHVIVATFWGTWDRLSLVPVPISLPGFVPFPLQTKVGMEAYLRNQSLFPFQLLFHFPSKQKSEWKLIIITSRYFPSYFCSISPPSEGQNGSLALHPVTISLLTFISFPLQTKVGMEIKTGCKGRVEFGWSRYQGEAVAVAHNVIHMFLPFCPVANPQDCSTWHKALLLQFSQLGRLLSVCLQRYLLRLCYCGAGHKWPQWWSGARTDIRQYCWHGTGISCSSVFHYFGEICEWVWRGSGLCNLIGNSVSVGDQECL